MTDEFQILSARSHVRLRTGVYLGSTTFEEVDRFVLGQWRTTQYVPALLKMVDEIIDNSVDEAIRTKFKYANEITVNVQKKSVKVTDNGRGIPLDEITDSESGEIFLRPVAAWTRLQAGSNFTEGERNLAGMNGVGSACVNFMSCLFVGQTWRDGRLVEVRSTNGAENTMVMESKASGNGTSVEFHPDFELLGVDSFEDGDHIELIHDRLNSLQIAFPEIKFKINGKLVKATNLKQYAELFSGENSYVTQQRENLAMIVTSSSDGYRQNGYVNGVNTRLGGSYNDYVINSVIDEMLTMIKRKYKVEVNRSTVKSGLVFVLFVRNFNDPQYDSQTKERLTSSQAAVKAHYENSDALNFEAIAKKIISCDDIIEPIVEAQVAKKAAADKRAATLAQKKLKRVKVQKHVVASGDNATLFLAEGDSAMGFLLKVRDPKTVGAFPLRGVVMNTYDKKPNEVLANKELSELIAVLGLDINDPNSVDNMYYSRIATLTDADHDGSHIAGLLLGFFYKYWPRLFSEGRVVVTRTPIMISTKGGKTKWFYSYGEAKEFKSNNTGWYHRYIKGLASLTEEEYDVIINQPRFDIIEIDNPAWFDVMFGKDSEPRKQWLKKEIPELVK